MKGIKTVTISQSALEEEKQLIKIDGTGSEMKEDLLFILSQAQENYEWFLKLENVLAAGALTSAMGDNPGVSLLRFILLRIIKEHAPQNFLPFLDVSSQEGHHLNLN